MPLFDVEDHLSVMGMLLAIDPGLAGILYNLVKNFETVYIYSVTAWVHSGVTKRMDIAEFTKPVARFICTKLVQRKAAFTLYQCKVNVLYG